MKFYKVTRDFYTEITGLKKGYYTKQELGIRDIDILDNMFEDGILKVVNEPYTARLVTQNGFQKDLQMYEYVRTIDIAKYREVQISNQAIAEMGNPFKDFEEVHGRKTFYYTKKIKGEKILIYEES